MGQFGVVNVDLDDLEAASKVSASVLGQRSDRLHGPHHGAHKSTSTNTDDCTMRANSVPVAATIHGRSAWQAAQRGIPDATVGTRFRFPQVGHSITGGVFITSLAFRRSPTVPR